MKPVGYSGTPLARKLGLKEGSRLRSRYAPGEFHDWLEPLPPGVIDAEKGEVADVVVLFVTDRSILADEVEKAIPFLKDRGGLWIAWPKKSSKVPTDVTEDVLRDVILPMGLVDNKVCAISEVWSGLRFVRRLTR